ncbi:hypothetical protein I2494_02460 [Budviciaceae bacterium BWR-B9]|uniref:Uncharacterized protein n=1 Tax=Limnobaculum allomyrinae TaxID=2791986 RepID=A0ABS1ILH4_9GAMM|nr:MULTISPECIES: hypothetical protein [Limnobaculum]MBK5142596.1 hypothetical protein [Limnobaculum allomyrinae]MBV7690519.1 hypothetical protein [Limnobaculum sp. M2-1]
MRELSIVEVEQVSGAGFIQDSMASVGGFLGKTFGDTGITVVKGIAGKFSPALGAGLDLLTSTGIVNGENVGHLAGYTAGAFVEGTFSSIGTSFKNKFNFWK